MDFSIDEELWFGGDSDASAQKAALQLIAKVHGAKPFPEAAQRLVGMIQTPDYKVADVARVIESDPTLAARLLRIVNSAAYSLKTPCRSVLQAITLLGTAGVRDVVTGSLVVDLFRDSSEHAKAILEHASAVAAVARALALKCSFLAEDMFTCGLLHDLGKLMLLQVKGDEYEKLLEEYKDRADQLHVEERRLYGFDHAVVAGHLFSLWKLPQPIPKIVSWHHQAAKAHRVSQRLGSMVELIRMADKLVHELAKGPNATRDQLDLLARSEAAAFLDLTEARIEGMWAPLHKAYVASKDINAETAAVEEAPEHRDRIQTARKKVQCSFCKETTYGEECPRCARPLCQAHVPLIGRTCSLCEREYEKLKKRDNVSTTLLNFAGGAALMSVLLGLVVMLSGTKHGLPQVAIVFLASVAATSFVVGTYKRWSLRTRFLNSRTR